MNKAKPFFLQMSRRCPKGASDAIEYKCGCVIGTVLLYYDFIPIQDPQTMAQELLTLGLEWKITGKVRIAKEGYNITVAGSDQVMNQWIELFLKKYIPISNHTDFTRLFFKPSPGCRHVFDTLSVKVVNELCPFIGQTIDKPITSTLLVQHLKAIPDQGPIIRLSPPEFHQHLLENQGQLIDLRNYYESQLGHFDGAILPPIRRFSSLAQWMDQQPSFTPKVYTYCTGGVRCEKAAEYMAHKTQSQIYMLEGGIHNYLNWAHDNKVDSLFKGVNYVFDARQSLAPPNARPISRCRCGQETSRVTKCIGKGCHLILVQCLDCVQPWYCCSSCEAMDPRLPDPTQSFKPGMLRPKRSICTCEQERRHALGLEP